MKSTYVKISEVLERSRKAIAPHEFCNVSINAEWGNKYIGCSESALGRRLREMRQMGLVTSKRREGTSFVEYTLVARSPVQQELIQSIHSGGY